MKEKFYFDFHTCAQSTYSISKNDRALIIRLHHRHLSQETAGQATSLVDRIVGPQVLGRYVCLYLYAYAAKIESKKIAFVIKIHAIANPTKFWS